MQSERGIYTGAWIPEYTDGKAGVGECGIFGTGCIVKIDIQDVFNNLIFMGYFGYYSAFFCRCNI